MARVQTSPKRAQDEAIKALREIQEDFFNGPETMQEIERFQQEALRGEGISLEDLKQRLGM